MAIVNLSECFRRKNRIWMMRCRRVDARCVTRCTQFYLLYIHFGRRESEFVAIASATSKVTIASRESRWCISRPDHSLLFLASLPLAPRISRQGMPETESGACAPFRYYLPGEVVPAHRMTMKRSAACFES
jgi:hypothetical protein